MPSFNESQQASGEVFDDTSVRENRQFFQACARAESTGIIVSLIGFAILAGCAWLCAVSMNPTRPGSLSVFMVVSSIAIYPLGIGSGWLSHASFYRTTIPVLGMVIVFVFLGYLSLFGWMLLYILPVYPEGIPY